MSSSEANGPGEDRRGFLVVTGSSAGGIDALMSFVRNLPDRLPMPIVVAQHLAPQHESRLKEILAQYTPLRVETIVDEAVLQAGHIYIVPPNHDVELVDSHAVTKLQAKKGPKPSID
ncbi:MAG: hypothetical protein JOZ38_03900, partial [Candidatus Eremiobacteraeota bacterium]|nr:hypothetical protein [Candidatus Eremiobacteraeota bacterium]